MAFSGDVMLNFLGGGGFSFKMQGPNSKNTRTNLKQQPRNKPKATSKNQQGKIKTFRKYFLMTFSPDQLLRPLLKQRFATPLPSGT